jgi:biopolymer transport protein ExbB
MTPHSTLWELIQLGGWSLWPILFCVAIGLLFFIERMFDLQKSKQAPKGFEKDVAHLVDTRGVDSGLAMCLEKQNALSRALYAGLLRHGNTLLERDAAIRDEGARILYDLRRNGRWIRLAALLSPLLGLAGTVTGLIATGAALSGPATNLSGTALAEAAASGAASALIPFACGLLAAIPLVVLHHVARVKAGDIMRDISERAAETVITLDRKARRSMRLIEDLEENLETQEMAAAKPAPLLEDEFLDNSDKTIKSSVTTPSHLPAITAQDLARPNSAHGELKAVKDPAASSGKSSSSAGHATR